MESLGSLNASLPPEQQAEQALAASFRNAALALTGLFKHGKKASTKAYLAGQKHAFQEVLEFVQTSLNEPARHGSSVGAAGGYSANGAGGVVAPGGGLDVTRLINFICARQEAVTAEEEENNDDDEPSPSASSVPPRRATSAAPSPPSPLRPGMLPRSASAVPAQPPRPASATPIVASTSSQPHQLRHQSVASTSSSAPASPPSSTFSPPFTRPTLFSSSTNAAAPPNSFAAPASPSPLGPSSSSVTSTSHAHPPPALPTFSFSRPGTGGPPSPLTRPPSHSRSHRSRTCLRGSKSGTATPTTVDGEGADGIDLSAGMKRRWGVAGVAAAAGAGAVSPADGVVELPDEAGGMDVEAMMDMEGWDGVGERPYKRVTRTQRGSGASTPAGGGGEQEQQ